MAKYIGIQTNVDDRLHVLHFQLENSEEEALNAYSGGLIARNAFYFERGRISELEMRRFEKEIAQYARNITVSPVCGTYIDHDIRNAIAEYRKINSRTPDIVIIDSGPLERRFATTMGSRARAVETHRRSQ